MIMGFGRVLMQKQQVVLRQDQKLQLKLLLEQRLEDPEFPDAVKGFERMKKADKILKENNVRGLLIGGLSEAVWNYRRKEEELLTHKDVDVMILDNSVIPDRFEGGIDWWMLREERIEFKDKYSNTSVRNSEWFRNFNGIVLGYKIKFSLQNGSGLYIPDRDSVVNMRLVEAKAKIGMAGEGDSDIEEAFTNKKLNSIGTSVPKFVKDYFKEKIIGYDSNSDYLTVDEFSEPAEYSKILSIEESS